MDYNGSLEREITEYDKTAEFESEVLPLIKQLNAKCRLLRIPYIASFAPKNKDGKTTYKHDGNLTGSQKLELYDDRFLQYLLVIQGAKVFPLSDFTLTEQDQDYIDYVPDDDDMDEAPVQEIASEPSSELSSEPAPSVPEDPVSEEPGSDIREDQVTENNDETEASAEPDDQEDADDIQEPVVEKIETFEISDPASGEIVIVGDL